MKAAADGYDPTIRPKLWKSNPKLGEMQLDERARKDCKRRDSPVCERLRQWLRFPRNESQPLPFPDLEISEGAWRVWEMGGRESAKQLCH